MAWLLVVDHNINIYSPEFPKNRNSVCVGDVCR